jgi:hypothetical protein
MGAAVVSIGILERFDARLDTFHSRVKHVGFVSSINKRGHQRCGVSISIFVSKTELARFKLLLGAVELSMSKTDGIEPC